MNRGETLTVRRPCHTGWGWRSILRSRSTECTVTRRIFQIEHPRDIPIAECQSLPILRESNRPRATSRHHEVEVLETCAEQVVQCLCVLAALRIEPDHGIFPGNPEMFPVWAVRERES